MSIQSLYPSIAPSLNLDFSGSKVLDSRVTFTRASEGRFYDGRTFAKAEENLLLRSQELDNAGGWQVIGATISANSTAAPDGTTTADTFAATASTGQKRLDQATTSVVGSQRVFSCFVKANTHNFVQLMFGTDLQAFANFNVTAGAGAVGTVGSAATASIVDAGNGWYRCIITTSSATASATVFILIVSSATAARFESWTTAGTETVFLWGAQLEQRSTVTAYTPTTTQPITRYQPVLMTAANNVARFDHNPVTGESLGLLVEEQRTNLLLRSEEFDNAAWGKTASSVTANTAIAPDGTLTADKLVEDTSTGNHFASQFASVTSGTAYTVFVYAKAAERGWLQIRFTSGFTDSNVYFDLVNGAVGTSTGPVGSISAVGNGWYRCSATATATSTVPGAFRLTIATSGTVANYTGDGYSGIYIWGAQLEAGAFPTSYIPTTASQATRNADAASMTGANFSSWYRQDEGSFLANFSYSGFNNFTRVWQVDDGTNSNWHVVSNTAGLSRIYAVSRVGGVDQVDTSSVSNNATIGVPTSAAFAYKQNDSAFQFGTNAVATDASGLVPLVSVLRIGSAINANHLNGHIRKLAYYPARLTNSQLQAITS